MIVPLIAALAIVGPSGSDISADPAFRLAKALVGGHWTGTVGKGTPVDFTFSLEEKGSKIVGRGVVAGGSKNPMSVHSSLGWDAAVKQVYYLDEHGFDTVYFGHMTRDGDALVFDFRGLVGDEGHYRSRTVISGDSYQAEMSSEKDGKWTSMGFHLSLTRRR